MTNVFNVNVTKVTVLLIYIKYYVFEHIKKLFFIRFVMVLKCKF
jgi:hypothetical protein